MTATLRRIELRSVVWEVLALVTLVSALVWPTILQLVDKWRPIADNVLGHSWPVVAVALWGLIRDARSVPVRLPWRIERVPLLFTAIVSGAWALAFQAALGAAQQMIWPFFIGGVIWATLGAPALRALSRALSLLLFVVPVWVVMHGFLWTTTTIAVHALLNAIGLPVEFKGNLISLPSGRIEIAAGCAGLGFFTAAVSCGAIIGYLNRATWRAQLILIGVAGAVAMICNWIRIVIIVFEADRTAMRTPLITESHYTFGWIVFSIGLVAYCLIFGRYGLSADGPVQRVVPQLLFRPLPVAVLLVCAALGPAAVAASRPIERSVVDSTFVMPLDGPWRRVASVDATAWQPHYPGADRAVLYESTTAGEPMFLYANLFLSQSQSKKVVSDENSVLPEAGWQIVSTRLVGDTIELLATDSLNTQWLVHYTYVAGYSVSANGRRSQLSYAWQQFWSDPAAGVVALAIRCQARCINESGVADRVWVQNAALLIRQIQAAGI